MGYGDVAFSGDGGVSLEGGVGGGRRRGTLLLERRQDEGLHKRNKMIEEMMTMP